MWFVKFHHVNDISFRAITLRLVAPLFSLDLGVYLDSNTSVRSHVDWLVCTTHVFRHPPQHSTMIARLILAIDAHLQFRHARHTGLMHATSQPAGQPDCVISTD